jgi:hypothetical protein
LAELFIAIRMVAVVIVHGKTTYQRIKNDENKETTGNK